MDADLSPRPSRLGWLAGCLAVLVTAALGILAARSHPAKPEAALRSVASASAGGLAPGPTAPAPSVGGAHVADTAGDIDYWALPLDAYEPRFDRVEEYGETLLIRDCLEERGYALPVPPQSIEELSDTGASHNQVGRSLFNLQIAELFGYHEALPGGPGREAWYSFVNGGDHGRYGVPDGDFVQCRDAVRALHPLPPRDALSFALGLAVQSATEARSTAEAQGAAARWQACMKENGYPDVPSSPGDMPTPEIVATFRLAVPGSVAGTEEKAMAVVDATCLEDSQWSVVVYSSERRLQEESLRQNATVLAPLRAALESRRAAMLAAITQ